VLPYWSNPPPVPRRRAATGGPVTNVAAPSSAPPGSTCSWLGIARVKSSRAAAPGTASAAVLRRLHKIRGDELDAVIRFSGGWNPLVVRELAVGVEVEVQRARLAAMVFDCRPLASGQNVVEDVMQAGSLLRASWRKRSVLVSESKPP